MEINDHSMLLSDINVKHMDMTVYLKRMQVISNATQMGYFLLWVNPNPNTLNLTLTNPNPNPNPN